jgi:hypothetical protein
MTQSDRDAAAGPSTFAPRVPGVFILPNSNNVIDMARLVGGNVQGFVVETITGGVPDASDQLPEGTIIISP